MVPEDLFARIQWAKLTFKVNIFFIPPIYLPKQNIDNTKRKGKLPFSEPPTQLLSNNTINFVFQSCTRHCFRAFKWYGATIQKWYWTNGIKSNCIYCQWRKKWKQKGRRPVPTSLRIIGFHSIGRIVQLHLIKVNYWFYYQVWVFGDIFWRNLVVLAFFANEEKNESKREEDQYQPTLGLLDFIPLAELCNSILSR